MRQDFMMLNLGAFMSNPKHTLFWMTVYLLIVATVCALIYEPISAAFMANWVFNSLILAVLVIGIGLTYRQVFILQPELEWIALFRTGRSGLVSDSFPIYFALSGPFELTDCPCEWPGGGDCRRSCPLFVAFVAF